MFTLEVETQNGVRLKLTQNETDYQVISIEGLNPPNAKISTTMSANADGVKFKSSKLEARNLVLTIKINGDVEKNRLQLYQFFGTGRYCKIYYSNNSRNVFCEGHIETIECNLFVINEQMQISILCENPYLFALQNIVSDISKTFANFEFPFAIEKEGIEFSLFDLYRQATVINSGEVVTGMIITLQARTNNIINPVIYNVETGEFMKLNITMNDGDIIVINTNTNKKSVKKIIDGIIYNALNSLDKNSTWLNLQLGNNLFTYTSDSNEEFLDVTFEHSHLFEGV